MKLKANAYAPLLFGVMMILVGFSERLIELVNRVSEDGFLSLAIIQLVVFLLPLAFYCRVRGVNIVSSLKIRVFSVKKLPLMVILSFLFITGSLFLRYCGISFLGGAFVDTPSAVHLPMQTDKIALVILCFIIIPALLEEIVFRGVLLSEYREYGSFWAVVMSSLAFAMVHGSLKNFLYYFFFGVILGVMTLMSDSLLPALALHLFDNISYYFIRSSVIDYVRQTGKSALLPFLLVAMILFLIFLMLSGLENIYREKAMSELLQSRKEILRREAEKERGEESGAKEEKKKLLSAIKELFLTPAFLAAAAIFFVLAADVI